MKKINSKKLSLSRVTVANLTVATGGGEGVDASGTSAPLRSARCAISCGSPCNEDSSTPIKVSADLGPGI